MSAPINDPPMAVGFDPKSDHVQEAISDTYELIDQILKDFKQEIGCDDQFVAEFIEDCVLPKWRGRHV